MIEQYCLDRCLQGRLKLVSGSVVHIARNGQTYTKNPVANGKGRYRYLFKLDGKVLGVYTSRLIWILTYRRFIPFGMVVDHIDGDRTNDSSSNLRLMTAKASHRQGNSVVCDAVLESLGCWFVKVGNELMLRAKRAIEPAELTWLNEGF